MVLTNSLNLLVSDPTFQLPKQILFGSTSFFTLRTRRLRCEDLCSFFTTPGRRCSAPLRKRRPDPCPLDTMPRSRHGASRGWRPGPCSFNIIPGFRYGASLRGLRPNDFLSGFISIRMARFNVGSPRLTFLFGVDHESSFAFRFSVTLSWESLTEKAQCHILNLVPQRTYYTS